MAGRGRWSGETTRGPAFAALDLGTNNCRLLVARPSPDGFRVIDAFSRIVRLGEGLSRTGRLSEEAIRRTIDALRICSRKMRRRLVVRSRHVATEACRPAANCDQFLRRVRNETGIDLEIISTDEEAHLALAGCSPLLEGTEPRGLVFDIGGGSTELIWTSFDAGRKPNGLLETLSLPIGVITLAERFGGDRFDAQIYGEMVEGVEALLREFDSTHRIAEAVRAGQVQMLGTSGTVTTLASVSRRLPRYDRSLVDGTYLDRETVRTLSQRLARMSYRERAEIGCIGPERADLVVAGAAILDAIWNMWPVPRLRVADRGLREGILLNLMAEGGQSKSVPLN